MKGRKQLPTKIKALKGTLRKHRASKNEPIPENKIPDPPKHLCPRAKAEWERISVELFKLGLLTNIDGSMLALYCAAYAIWEDATEKLQKTGLVIKSPNGYPIQSPYLTISARAIDQINGLLCQFGMSPSSRSRVAVAEKPKEENVFLTLLSSKKRS